VLLGRSLERSAPSGARWLRLAR